MIVLMIIHVIIQIDHLCLNMETASSPQATVGERYESISCPNHYFLIFTAYIQALLAIEFSIIFTHFHSYTQPHKYEQIASE